MKTTSSIFELMQPIRNYLDSVEINNPELARWICQVVPAQCPFARDVTFFGHHLFHIPPLCKLNPFYEEIVGLRWRALCYLADECSEFIT